MYKDRIFIVSDLHGLGNVYFGIIDYLEKLQQMHPEQKIILYINGDLIDRGSDSIKMLLDVIERSKGKGLIEVHMMAGNHELIMYEAIVNRRNGEWIDFVKLSLEKQHEITKFLSELPLYKTFDGYIVGKDGIVLAHACPPNKFIDFDKWDLTLKYAYCDRDIADIVWKRKKDLDDGEFIGLDNYFSIVGHTHNKSKSGFKFNKEACTINIDGGCGYKYNIDELRVPVLELDYVHDKVKIHGFDWNGRCQYRKTFAEYGEIVSKKKKVNNSKKYLDTNYSLFDKLVELARTSKEEFYKFISFNKRKLAALGVLMGLLTIGVNYVNDVENISIGVSDEFFDEDGFGIIDIKVDDEVVPVMCNNSEIEEFVDEVPCFNGESLDVLAEQYGTTVSTLVDLNGDLVQCDDGNYYVCSDEIIVPDNESIEKRKIKNYR